MISICRAAVLCLASKWAAWHADRWRHLCRAPVRGTILDPARTREVFLSLADLTSGPRMLDRHVMLTMLYNTRRRQGQSFDQIYCFSCKHPAAIISDPATNQYCPLYILQHTALWRLWVQSKLPFGEGFIDTHANAMSGGDNLFQHTSPLEQRFSEIDWSIKKAIKQKSYFQLYKLVYSISYMSGHWSCHGQGGFSGSILFGNWVVRTNFPTSKSISKM